MLKRLNYRDEFDNSITKHNSDIQNVALISELFILQAQRIQHH